MHFTTSGQEMEWALFLQPRSPHGAWWSSRIWRKTSSSAIADRPCDWRVLCLRPKSSLCSCRRLLYVRPALHRTWPVYVAKSAFFEGGLVTFGEHFRGKGAWPANHCWCHKTRVTALSCGMKISAVHYLGLVLSQYMRLTDGRTELRQEHRALHEMQSHSKNEESKSP